MATTSFSKKAWESIISCILVAGLPMMGANQHFPRDIVFASEQHHGFDFQHPFYLQVIKQLQMLFTHFYEATPTSKLLRANWEALVQVSGLRDTTKAWPWKKINQYIPLSWLGKLLEHAQDHGIEVSFPLDKRLPREKDKTIMDIFLDQGIAPTKLCLLNEVRMAKGITWESEILHASGKRLMPSSFSTKQFPARGGWPRTAPVDAQMLELWEVSLRQCLLDPNGSIALQIREPLGWWKDEKGVWMWSD